MSDKYKRIPLMEGDMVRTKVHKVLYSFLRDLDPSEYDGCPCCEGISPDGNVSCMPYAILEGIPLTPEILREWFGFVEYALDFFRICGGQFTYVKTTKIMFADGTPYPHIKQVHELQQLYRALTGEPLIRKL